VNLHIISLGQSARTDKRDPDVYVPC